MALFQCHSLSISLYINCTLCKIVSLTFHNLSLLITISVNIILFKYHTPSVSLSNPIMSLSFNILLCQYHFCQYHSLLVWPYHTQFYSFPSYHPPSCTKLWNTLSLYSVPSGLTRDYPTINVSVEVWCMGKFPIHLTSTKTLVVRNRGRVLIGCEWW